jgi:hypothetical protein
MLYWYLVLFAYIYPAQASDIPASVWKEFNDRFQTFITSRGNGHSFSGSLIDPKMFAIDVNEWGERDLYRELWDSYPHRLQEINTTRSKE